jgi:starch-binding outer membrane protein, SusD/RagB family
MTNMRKRFVLAATLLLTGAAGCVDLDVTNPNNPDAGRALRTPGDVESLMAGAYRQWWNAEQFHGTATWSAGQMLSVQSFQHSAFPANWGMYQYSEYPRAQLQNDPAHQFYQNWGTPWAFNYRGVSSIRDGLLAINSGQVNLAANTQRAKAWGKFMQGLHHGSIALLFDKGFIVDETTDMAAIEPQPYTAVMAAALKYLDDAIALTNTSFTIPADWTSVAMSNVELRQLAYAYKARLRANVARTAAERAAVNWAAVIADANQGITKDFNMNIDWINWENYVGFYTTYEFSWSQMHYQILGMADQSGHYQTWINLPIAQRHPNLPGGVQFTIITPDKRFPQGADLTTHRANPGKYYQAQAAPTWGQPGRGSHRWSYYSDQRYREWRNEDGPFTWFTLEELDLLKAEANFRTGNLAAAADLINKTRVGNGGLNATNAAGLNTSCVPKLPDGSCGGLFEMLKWEFRLETQYQGMFGAPWYFLNRGWDDLYRGTQLEFPVPCREMQIMLQECYTFGGVGGPRASTGSSYKFPFE